MTINAEVRDVHGVPKLGQTITLPELQPGYFKLQTSQAKSTQRHCTLESELPWYRKYILAITFIGTLIGKFSQCHQLEVARKTPCSVHYIIRIFRSCHC